MNNKVSPGGKNKTDVSLARVCELCPVCRQARRRQRGLAFELVNMVERRVCPFCRAYERVHGRLAHAPVVCDQSGH